jgi:hypothetical protein
LQPFGDLGVLINGFNLGVLKIAQSDLDCAVEFLNEKTQGDFGGKMHFYLQGMINA